MGTPTHTTEQRNSNSDSDSLINKKTPGIIFKMKEYYIIYIWNRKNIDFDISETAAKNILIYWIFNKENWDRETKEYNYWYIN